LNKNIKQSNTNVEGSETKWIKKLKELPVRLKTASSMMNQTTVMPAQSVLVTDLLQAFPIQLVKHLNAVTVVNADNKPF